MSTILVRIRNDDERDAFFDFVEFHSKRGIVKGLKCKHCGFEVEHRNYPAPHHCEMPNEEILQLLEDGILAS